jgi:signal transduction histidine kinase
MLNLFSVEQYLPHAICFAGDPALIATHVGADAVIALSYFSIPLAIFYFVRERQNLEFRWVAYLFVLFIFWCGVTHAAASVTVWYPVYGIQAVAKLITAAVSVATAFTVWWIIPKALALPAPADLRAANAALEEEVSTRRQTEAELRKARDELEERVAERTAELERLNRKLASANADLTNFAARLSHDLRSPITFVKGYAELLQHGNAVREAPYTGYLDNVIEGVERMDAMIHALFQFSSTERGEAAMKPAALSQICSEVADTMAEPMAEAGGQLSFADDLPAVQGDRALLFLLLQNLVANAVKYRGDAPPRIAISAEPAGGHVRVSVSDNGRGVPEAERERIFEMFERGGADKTEPGSGIGLATCRRIVERHGGEIRCEGRPEGGSVFKFTLPAAPAA